MKRFYIPCGILPILLLLVGCMTAKWEWFSENFLPKDMTLGQLEKKIDESISHHTPLTSEDVMNNFVIRRWDAREGRPNFEIYSWVYSTRDGIDAGVGIVEGGNSTFTSSAFVAVFSKPNGENGKGMLIDYMTLEIPGINSSHMQFSTEPLVGPVFAYLLVTKLAAAIDTAGRDISSEIDEGDNNITGEIDEIDDETEDRLRRAARDAAKEVKEELDDIMKNIRRETKDIRGRIRSLD